MARKKINHCLGCFSCWLKSPGTCIQADDMPELMKQFQSADVVVFATPLHNDNVSGSMKDFIDRLLPLGDPHFEKDPEGEVRHVSGPKKAPRFFMIANCGFPEQSHFQVLRLLIRRMTRNFSTEVAGEIYRGWGSSLQDNELKPHVDAYKGLLRTAGMEFAKTGKLSAETARRLEEPLIPAPNYAEIFISNANAYMDQMIEANRKG